MKSSIFKDSHQNFSLKIKKIKEISYFYGLTSNFIISRLIDKFM
jgi:hypothetical protein